MKFPKKLKNEGRRKHQMMTYSQFTQYVELHIREYVSEEMMVSSKTWQQKNNGVPIEGLVFKDTGALVDMPVMVYFKDLYEKYCKGDASINSFLQETVSELSNSVSTKFMDSFTDRIFFRMVNAEKNRNKLSSCPCRQVGDFLIEYRLIAFQNEFGMGSVAINNEIANSIGLNEEQLYQLSMKNTEKVFPVSFQNLTTLTEGIQKNGQIPPGHEIRVDKNDALPVYSLSNKEGLNGASTILYPQVQEDLKKEFPNGYYVLPSSIHEVLIVDQSFVEEPLDLFALKEAVLEVNYQVVEPSEFLSNEVYEVKGPDFQLEKATFLNHKKEKNMER